MTAQSKKPQKDEWRSADKQRAVARTLEIELRLLTEERKERARRLGLEAEPG